MDDRPFYYRVRGRTLGPLDLRQMRQLAQRAQLGRTTDVSRDGLQWSKAGDFPELFAIREATDAEASLLIGGGLPSGTGKMTADGTLGQETATEPRWYYTQSGTQQGPVDMATLQQLVARGAVSPHEHVIPEGGSQWLPVTSVPQLGGGAAAVAQPPAIDTAVRASSTRRPEQHGTNGLAIAGFVVSLVTACCFLPGLVFLPLLGIAMFAVPVLAIVATTLSACGLAVKTPSQRGLAVAGLVIGIVMLLIAVLLWVLAAIGIAIGINQMR